MTDPAPGNSGTLSPAASAAPAIAWAADKIISGTGFLADHNVIICVAYTAEHTCDYLTYTTDRGGGLCAELPISRTTGALLITATDHCADPGGGLLWSNTLTVTPRKAGRLWRRWASTPLPAQRPWWRGPARP